MSINFQIQKIPVKIYPNFIIIVLLLGLGRLNQPAFLISWFIVVIISILLHELGHALAARYFGDSPSIELRGFTGLTYVSNYKNKMLPKIIVPLAGPVTGIIIGLIFLWTATRLPSARTTLLIIWADIIWVNLYWSLANLLPVLPLDGGHISLAVFTRLFKFKGRLISYVLSFIIIVPLGIYMAATGNLYIVMLLGYLLIYNFQHFQYFFKRKEDARYGIEIANCYRLLQAKKAAEVIPRARSLLEQVTNPQVKKEILQLLSRAYFSNRDFDLALQILEHIEKKSPDDNKLLALIHFTRKNFSGACEFFQKVICSQAGEDVANPYLAALLKTGQLEKAYHLVSGFLQHKINPALLVQLAADLYSAGHFKQSLQVSTIIFGRQKSGKAAYAAARTLVKLGRHKQALVWLEKAVRAGFNDLKKLQTDEDWADFQDDTRFQGLADRILQLKDGRNETRPPAQD